MCIFVLYFFIFFFFFFFFFFCFLFLYFFFFFFSSRRRHTRFDCDWSSDVCSSDLITWNISTNIQGYQRALPARYDSVLKKYPLLIFIHGAGEMGNGSTDLYKVANVGVPALIKNKQFPPAFKVNDTSYSFIVISPQCKTVPSDVDMNALLDHAISKYRIDTTRIYVSGLSMGGGVTWVFGAASAQRISAIVPICGASSPTDSRAQKIAQAGLAVWAFHNKNDSTVTYTNSTGYVTKINGFGANPQAKLTLWLTGGHNAWTKACN